MSAQEGAAEPGEAAPSVDAAVDVPVADAAPADPIPAAPPVAEPAPSDAPDAPSAPDPARLAALVEEGTQHFDRRSWVAAADTFTAALEHTRDPEIVAALAYNVAAALERTPALDRAIAAWRRYGETSTDASAEAEPAIAALLARAAAVEIRTSAPSEVFVDEVSLGSAPGTFHVPPGSEVTFEVRADGYARAHRTIALEAAQVASLEIVLVRTDAALDEAQARITRGEALFSDGSFDAALAEFEAAYELLAGGGDMYLALYNIALCHQRLGRVDLAVHYYEAYLDAAPAAEPGRAEVEASVRTLRDLLGTLVLETNVDGVEVWVDGRRLGTAPGEVRLGGGLHDVELRSAGVESERFEVQIAAGQRLERTVELTLLAEGGGLGPGAFVAAAVVTGLGVIAWAGLGIGSLTLRADILSRGPDGNRPEDYQLLDAVSLAADVSLAVTGAALITTIVLAAATDWDGGGPVRARRDVLAVRPFAGPTGGGVTLGGTF